MPRLSSGDLVPESDPSQIGGWTVDDLKAAVQTRSGTGADQGVPDPTRFAGAIAKLLIARLAHTEAASDSTWPAVFLLAPSINLVRKIGSPERVPILNDGSQAVNGKVWFVNAPAASGHFIDYDVADLNALFNLVTESMSLGNVPAIVFNPQASAPEIRVYPRGMSDPDACDIVSLEDVDISLEQVYSRIEKVYESCLATPDAQNPKVKLWADPSKWWPVSDAEGLVQAQLHAALAAAFLTCTVRAEQSMPIGRDDLEIERPVDRRRPAVVKRLVLIELKVLRSFTAGGRRISKASELDRITEGVEQASAYASDKGFQLATLCCFDMRSTNAGALCFAHVQAMAGRLHVDLRQWFIYSSSQQRRKDLAAGRSRITRASGQAATP
jgi:hypothetical protein